MRIRDVIEPNLDVAINEIIKLSDATERQVAAEINEYVVTDDLETHLSNILRRLCRGLKHGEQNVGFWVSGFYGSGKSSLVKILSYALEDTLLLGRRASALLLERTSGSKELAAGLAEIVGRKPVVVRFDLQGDRDLTAFDNEPFSSIAWRAIRRGLKYADSLRLSELEMRLEEEGTLERFQTAYDQRFGAGAWERQKHKEEPGLDNASAVLNALWPDIYTSADTWASRERAVPLTANKVPERAAELVDRRLGKGRPLILVADEVGHFIGRSADRMQDVQGLIEALGKSLRGRGWFFVTAQERLDSVFTSLPGTSDRQKSELPKLRDRFLQIDLAPKDIGEVTQRRLLRKTPSGATELAARFKSTKDALKVHTELTGAAAFATSPELAALSESNFVNFYPFLPYQVDLVLHIISGIRDQGGVHRLTGGAARTLIRLVQDVLTQHPRLKMAERPVGELVTLDAVYDQQEANLPGERRTDLDAVRAAFPDEPFVVKVAKALCMLEYADSRAALGSGPDSKGLVPRTVENLAAVLHPGVDAPSQRAAVEAALGKLVEKQRARRTAAGFELLTPAAERWERERDGLKLPRESREAELKDAIKRLLEDESAWRHPRGRRFTAGWTLDGKALFPGSRDLKIELRRTAGGRRDDQLRSAEADTRRDPLLACWVLKGDEQLDDLADEIVRSGKMIAQYQTSTGHIYAKLLHDERARLDESRRLLRQKTQEALLSGAVVTQGVVTGLDEFGSNLVEGTRHLLEKLVAEQFRDYELAALADAEPFIRQVLTARLEDLPEALHGAEGGIALLSRDAGRVVVHAEGKVAATVLTSVGAQGRRGQEIERELNLPTYGWTEDTVRLVLAALFRAGLLQVTHKGRTLTVTSEPGALEPFTQRSAFSAAVFSRRQDGVDNKMRVAAARALSAMGETATPDEAEIHRGVQRAAGRLRDGLVSLETKLQTLSLPGGDRVRQVRESLSTLASASAVEATRSLAASGEDLCEGVAWAEKLSRALTPEAITRIQNGREVCAKLLPALTAHGTLPEPLASEAAKLAGWLSRDGVMERLVDIARITGALVAAYTECRRELGKRRSAAYHEALERLRADESFTALARQDPQLAERVAAPLVEGASPLPEEAPWEQPSLSQLSADIAAVSGRLHEAVVQLERARAPPEEPPEVIPVRRYVFGALSDEKELNDRIDGLRDACLRALRRGRKVILE